MNWQWLIDQGLIEGDAAYYESGGAQPSEYSHAIEEAYKNSTDANRQQLIDMLWETGTFSGDQKYWYEDRTSEAGDLGAAAGGMLGVGGEGQDLMSVGGKPQVWKVGNDTYLVYTTTGSDGQPIRLSWKATSDADVQSFFGPDQPIVYNQTLASMPPDVMNFGSTDELANMSDDPITTWSNTLEVEAKTQPWLLDPDYQKYSLMAVLEGRALTEGEIKLTSWWKGHTEGQREWMVRFHGDPMTAQKEIDDQRILTTQMLQQYGINNATPEIINYISDQRAMGNWSDVYFNNQLKGLSDPASGISLDVGLQTIVGDTSLDTTQGGEAEVQDLIKMWLGPSFGDWDQSTISYWAGQIRNDPDAKLALVEQLKDQKQAIYQGYDRESTYSTIAAPWKQFIGSMWGETVQDSDNVLSDVINMNNAGEAGQYLTSEGLKRGNDNVVNRVQGDLNAAFGGV